MIRLYLDDDFVMGHLVKIPDSEWHYLKRVRRGRGEIEFFNRKGQCARGEILDRSVRIREVFHNPCPLYDLDVALGRPDDSVLPDVIRGLSELGVRKLILFEAKRSQGRLQSESMWRRWNQVSIESTRQCGRGTPLILETSTFDELLKIENRRMIVFDEAPTFASDHEIQHSNAALIFVGPEGGWTKEERDEFSKKGDISFCHFQTPVLRVATASICASFFTLCRLTPIRSMGDMPG